MSAVPSRYRYMQGRLIEGETGDETILCAKCDTEKPAVLFTIRTSAGREIRRRTCNPCRRKCPGHRRYAAKYNALTQAQKKAARQELCDKLGISACQVCGSDDEELHVDHEHRSGAVRGLLCRRCNVGIGFFQDDPIRLRVAAAYLEGIAP